MTYLWPPTLRLPARPPKLVYLDLLHWIALSKANKSRPDGDQFKDVLKSCVEAVKQGAAVFPISDAIFMEVAKIGPHRQRRDLREVIELVSRYMVVTSREVVAEHEVEALLDRLVGPRPDPINEMDYLDWGVARAFGKVGGLRVIRGDDGADITEEVRARDPGGPNAFDRKIAWAELELNRRTLEGPTAEEEPELRREGWDPMAAMEVTAQRATQEIEQVQRFNTNRAWRLGHLRDVVMAREVLIEINEMLSRGLTARDTTVEAAFPDPEVARHAFDVMPSFDVSVSLKTAYHRNPAHNWTPNDIYDIDALASTLPYCDIVLTDKQAASTVVQSGLSKRFEAVVLPHLADLPKYL